MAWLFNYRFQFPYSLSSQACLIPSLWVPVRVLMLVLEMLFAGAPQTTNTWDAYMVWTPLLFSLSSSPSVLQQVGRTSLSLLCQHVTLEPRQSCLSALCPLYSRVTWENISSASVWSALLGDDSSWVSHISPHLMSRNTSCLCSRLSFLGVFA